MTARESGYLPGGAPLAAGETELVADQFILSTIAFYLRTDLVLTNRRLYALRPNVVLGIVPVGRAQSSFPIENIAGISASTRFNMASVVVGLFGIVLGILWLPLHATAVLGGIVILLGIVVILGAPKQAIEVMNSGGGVIRFTVSVVDRSRTIIFANDVSEAVARTTRRGAGGPAPSSERTGGEGRPAEALSHLDELRGRGLITEKEYDAKRAEILARL